MLRITHAWNCVGEKKLVLGWFPKRWKQGDNSTTGIVRPSETNYQEDTEAVPGQRQTRSSLILHCPCPRSADNNNKNTVPGVRLADAKMPALPAVVSHAIIAMNYFTLWNPHPANTLWDGNNAYSQQGNEKQSGLYKPNRADI